MNSFEQWLTAMMDVDARIAMGMAVMRKGETAAQWRNYNPEPARTDAPDGLAATAGTSNAMPDMALTSDEEIVFLFEIEDLRRVLKIPKLQNIAILLMTAPDRRDRLYAFIDDGEQTVTVKAFSGPVGGPWNQFLPGSKKTMVWADTIRAIEERVKRLGYVPKPVWEVTRALVRIGEVL